jgi:hypothetical protein
MGARIVRMIGNARARFKIGMMHLGYNIYRLIQLEADGVRIGLKRSAGCVATALPPPLSLYRRSPEIKAARTADARRRIRRRRRPPSISSACQLTAVIVRGALQCRWIT